MCRHRVNTANEAATSPLRRLKVQRSVIRLGFWQPFFHMTDYEVPVLTCCESSSTSDEQNALNTPNTANTEQLPDQTTIYKNESSEDADSAPIELLSEFLSAIMSRNYAEALQCCKTILYYEPDNKIVQEFYPLIQARLKQIEDGDLENPLSSDDETNCEDGDFSSSSSSASELGNDEVNDPNSNSTSSGDGNGWATALNTDSDSTEKDEVEHDSNSNHLYPITESIDICDNKIINLTL